VSLRERLGGMVPKLSWELIAFAFLSELDNLLLRELPRFIGKGEDAYRVDASLETNAAR